MSKDRKLAFRSGESLSLGEDIAGLGDPAEEERLRKERTEAHEAEKRNRGVERGFPVIKDIWGSDQTSPSPVEDDEFQPEETYHHLPIPPPSTLPSPPSPIPPQSPPPEASTPANEKPSETSPDDSRFRLEEIYRLTKEEAARASSPYDDRHPEDRKEKRIDEKSRQVHRATDGTFVCPDCRIKRPDSRSWCKWKSRRNPDGPSLLICFSCASRRSRLERAGNDVDSRIAFNFTIFEKVRHPKDFRRYIVRGDEVRAIRISKSMSIRECAVLGGWSPGYQQVIEGSQEPRISEENFKTLCVVLGHRFEAIAVIITSALEFFIRPQEFKQVRRQIAMSNQHLASIIGLTVSALHPILSGNRAITEERARAILEELRSLDVSTLDSLPSFQLIEKIDSPASQPREILPRYVRSPTDPATFPEDLKQKDASKTDEDQK